MALHLYNVRTRRKEPFVPLRPGRVGLYVCGLTVYDDTHIGHARTYTSFEVIRRWLEHRVGPVHHVQNVTDVDDKILARAKEKGVSPRAHAAEWDARCRAEMERLGIRVPVGADNPHVTTSIPDIVRFVEGIVANGFAYATAAGNVYFDVPAYDAHAAAHLKDANGHPCGYGSLSNRDYKQMAAGTRKEVESDKRHPADFALWKGADADDHADANWTSPWGRGRPGWHIECSLMATRALGDTFDLHGGGQDLIFPHHENEIAQSQAKTGKAPFVQTWLHTGFLNVEGEKMSKSLGNFITLRACLDDLEKAHGIGRAADVLRFYFLQTHYRSKIDFSRKGLDEAAVALKRLDETRARLHEAAAKPSHASTFVSATAEFVERFESALDDDVHTPQAIAALFDFQRSLNGALDSGSLAGPDAAHALDTIERCGRVLTLFQRPVPQHGSAAAPPALLALAPQFAVSTSGTSESALMDALLAARLAARAAKDWKRSDAIRDAAKSAGYLIEDAPTGQRWRKA